MNLNLRKVIHPQAYDNYRVVLKLDGDEFEIGSTGIQHGAAWIPSSRCSFWRSKERQEPQGLHAAVQGGLAAFAADEANLVEFLNAKRKRR